MPANEAIIDLRYPQFRSQVAAFSSSGLLEEMHTNVIKKILSEGGRQFGYRVDFGWVARKTTDRRSYEVGNLPYHFGITQFVANPCVYKSVETEKQRCHS